MNEQNRFLVLILIMVIVSFIGTGTSFKILYGTAIDEERGRLVETAQSQARLIEAVARFDSVYSQDYPEGSLAATLSQIRDAHNNYRGFGETGEFTLARRDGDQIVFILSHRHFDMNNPRPVMMESNLAEPMKRALSGQSGTVIGPDYRGEIVLAAHEPLQELGFGIVAKIDMAEIRAPFIKAGIIVSAIMILFIVFGASLFLKISNPIIRRLETQNRELSQANENLEEEIQARRKTEASLQKALQEVKQLSGLLPICSSCKKIRDDKGYWTQIEAYISKHSNARFSHGICQECAEKLYPEFMRHKKE